MFKNYLLNTFELLITLIFKQKLHHTFTIKN